MKPCRAIHSFGPAVGKWTVHGTVSETIARERKRLAQEAAAQKVVEQEQQAKVQPMRKTSK